MSLTYDQILFIQDQLSNNEFASNEEIENILIYEGYVPHFYIDELLGLRELFLTNPLATLDFECNQIKVRHV